jgi:hypothetical protein
VSDSESDYNWEDGILYCPDCGAMNTKIFVKDKGWCTNCRELWPEEDIPEEPLDTLREKYT